MLKKIPTLDLTAVRPSPDSAPAVVTPSAIVMPEPIKIPGDKTPTRISIYRHADGQAAFAIARFDGRKKLHLPITFNGTEYVHSGYTHTRPLYGSDILAAHPDWPVLVVEGEKAAEDGARWLPDGWCITTWAHGTESVGKNDWSILSGRRVVIWPDNDEAGLTAARKICSILGPTSAVVQLPIGLPPKWDLADPLPDGITDAMISASIRTAFAETVPPPVTSVLPDASPPAVVEEDSDGFVDEHIQWRPLGVDEGYYYVMPASTGVVLKMTARELMSPSGCLRIVNDLNHWASAHPKGKGDVDWILAGSAIMGLCELAGFYQESRLHGRGVWMDSGRVVVNLGDELIVDGKTVSPVKIKSRNIYRRDAGLFPDGLDGVPELTDAEGRTIAALCNAPRWVKPVHGDLLAGWIATSVVCGALEWRTHLWIDGNAGSGKSTVINRIAAACVGDVALYPMGETTESGIRQCMGSDARPVIFDEMEGTEAGRGGGDSRRQAIIQLMRMASTETKGRIMKGSASHRGAAFTMQSSFLVASIGMALKEAPDLTRTMVLTLRSLPRDAKPEEKQEAEERYASLLRLADKVPEDIPARLFKRMIRLVPVIRANAKMFREVIADALGNRRLGDQVGALLAGRCALTSQAVMTREQCREYLKRFDWDGVVVTATDREDLQLLSHLKQTVVRVVDSYARPTERTIGELVSLALGHEIDSVFEGATVHRCLLRFGIHVDVNEGGIWLSSRNDELNRLMRSSTNPGDWYSVVKRNPNAKMSRTAIRFAGDATAAVFIPQEEWYG